MSLKRFALLALVVPSLSNASKIPVMEQVSLRPGDVVVSINGKKMKNNLVAIKTMNELKTPSRMVMEVLHEGKIQRTVYDLK